MNSINKLQINKKHQIFNIMDIALIWAGINICLPSFMLGGILVPGLNLISALIITLLGNLILVVLIYLMAIPGLKKGYSSALISRYTFGYPYGSGLTSVLVIISMVGWAAILLELSGQAAYEIISYYNVKISFEIIIIIIGIIVISTSLAGPEKISKLNKLNVPILIILLLWITLIIFKDYNVMELLKYKATGNITYHKSLDLIIGGTISGVFVSSDLNRYAGDIKSLYLGVFIGTIPITLFLAIIGMLARVTTGSWNPVNIIKTLGMGIPAMLLLVLSVWTTIQASLYSGSLAAVNIFPDLNRKKATITLGTIMIFIGLYKVLDFENWLILLDNLFSPVIAISLYKIVLSKYKIITLDWIAVITIILVFLLKSIIPASSSSIILVMFYTFIIYILIESIVDLFFKFKFNCNE